MVTLMPELERAPSHDQSAILAAFDAARRARPRLPAIDIAQRLSISEGALQAARLGRDVIGLPLTPAELAGRFHTLGRVKALTRSRHAVLEQQGECPALGGAPQAGLLLAPGGLDMRLLFAHWHWACLIRDVLPDAQGQAQERLSLQVFDRHGRALLKLFCLEAWPGKGWQALESIGNVHPPVFTGAADPAPRPLPEAPGLADDWARLGDVHQFFTLLRRHGLARHEANTLMEGRFTRRLDTRAVATALTRAAERELPLMLFVASPGCVQIRTGRLPEPKRMRGWLNLFGEDFTLHLDDAAIASVWSVHKPNRDGGVTSLEAFDAQGELILQLYAERREGSGERGDWRDLLAGLRDEEAVA